MRNKETSDLVTQIVRKVTDLIKEAQTIELKAGDNGYTSFAHLKSHLWGFSFTVTKAGPRTTLQPDGSTFVSDGCHVSVLDYLGNPVGSLVFSYQPLLQACIERAKQLGASAPSVGSYHQPDLKSTLDALQKLNPEYVRLTADVPVKRFQPCVEFIIDQIRHCEVINYECHEANIPGTPVVRSIGLTAQIGTCAVIGYKMLNYASNRWWVDSTTIEGPNVKTKWRIPHIYDSDIFNALAERYNEITDNTNKVEPVAPVFPKPWEE